MNEMEFRRWLGQENYAKKVISDTVSRVKRVEGIYPCLELEDEFAKDHCEQVLSIFRNKGENEGMKKLNFSSLPVGSYQLSTYKYALALYVRFLEQL